MREIKELLVSKINELIDNGTVDRVIGWKAGEFCYDVSPAIFTKENLDELVYNSFCGANQSKFLVGAATMDVPFRAPNAPEPPQPKKILALLKPCDCYSYNPAADRAQTGRREGLCTGNPMYRNDRC